jgi:aminoglycoside phosphotransferase (APT) family kinase protein
VPFAVGEPGSGYPWHWSLLPWIPGQSADLDPPAADQAERFAGVLKALHQPAPEGAPHNIYRGVPLADRAQVTAERMDRLREITNQITPEVDEAWRAALAAPLAEQSTWVHGDLHARNVLVYEGSFTGIIDWGDLTSGDGSTDLAATWMLFDAPRARQRVLDAYDSSDTDASKMMRLRARGWAVFFGVVLLDTGLVDHPRHAAMGEATLRRVTEDG